MIRGHLVVVLGVLICGATYICATVPNLSEACFKCLCKAPTGCITFRGCPNGFCGPFHLSRIYWTDAGEPTLPGDIPEKENAFENCAKDYECAKRIVEGYLEKFGADCNSDGVIDCLDHMMVNANGGYDCSTPLNSTTIGNRWLVAYEKCKDTLV